jgi:hypothetical protein
MRSGGNEISASPVFPNSRILSPGDRGGIDALGSTWWAERYEKVPSTRECEKTRILQTLQTLQDYGPVAEMALYLFWPSARKAKSKNEDPKHEF